MKTAPTLLIPLACLLGCSSSDDSGGGDATAGSGGGGASSSGGGIGNGGDAGAAATGGGADSGGRAGGASGGAGAESGSGGTGASAGAGGAGASAGAGGANGGTAGTSGGSGGAGGAPSPPVACTPTDVGQLFHVATTGSDTTGDGSDQAPWATIDHALGSVPDGSTIVVAAGDYAGRVRLDEVFQEGVIVRSAAPYAARLRHDAAVVTSYYGEGITFEGFDVAHSGAGAGALVVQIQNLRTDGGTTGRIVLRNNVFHDSYNNDIVKVNNGAELVTIERNLFYNQTGSDEHIDINSVTDVIVQDNVFMNDFEGSGRTNANDTSSYVVIKDSNGTDDQNLGSQRITVRRNVFLNWQGSTGSNFVLIGEDGTANFEAIGVTVENNLMIGNSANTMRAAFGVKGSSDVTFRSNTVVGDLPSLAFAMRLNTEGSNMPSENVVLVNNVWADPSGTMDDFSDTPPGETASFLLDNNAYFNGGAALPEDAAELVNPSDDDSAVIGDPELGVHTGLVLPRLVDGTLDFADGSTSICEVHQRLVELYGTPGATSVVLGQADSTNVPAADILGTPRGSAPDIGAVEIP